MARYKLTVAYDGTDYCGFQIQPNGLPTIEGELRDALTKLLGQETRVIGASRTDAGVHAYGNVAVFDADTTIPGDRFSYALNTILPPAVKIQKSEEVDARFHPQYDAKQKTYEYHVFISEHQVPTALRYAHHVKDLPDLGAIGDAAGYLIGEHDFTSFCSAKTEKENKVRTIYELQNRIEERGDGRYEWILSVTGNGFLYNMVRILAGTLYFVGIGKIRPEEIPGILAAKDRARAGMTFPPNGLFLVEIQY